MTSVQQHGIDPATVAEALGAEDTGLTLECDGSPVSTFQIRAELVDRLRSHGEGRPSGTTRPIKIPVTDSQWQDSRNSRPRSAIWDLFRLLARSQASS